jgi:hypothetical protein
VTPAGRWRSGSPRRRKVEKPHFVMPGLVPGIHVLQL